MTSYALELQGITCTFRAKDGQSQGYTAVGDTSLHIRAEEFVSVVGPTGCGKSTLLNIGAGLLAPSLGGVKVFICGPPKRKLCCSSPTIWTKRLP
jgi:NitT/TauT family transport system ATP-binding protein